jgi:hypothetical protein
MAPMQTLHYHDPGPPTRPPHSGPGIASVLIAAATAVAFLAALEQAAEARRRASVYYLSIELHIVSYVVYAGALIGIALAIAGLAQKARRRRLPIVGLLLNAALAAATAIVVATAQRTGP